MSLETIGEEDEALSKYMTTAMPRREDLSEKEEIAQPFLDATNDEENQVHNYSEEGVMEFNREELENLENLLRQAEAYVGRVDSSASEDGSSAQDPSEDNSHNDESCPLIPISSVDMAFPPTERTLAVDVRSPISPSSPYRHTNYRFEQLQNELRSADTSHIILQILMDAVLFAAPVTVFYKKHDSTGECGIPLKMWITVQICLIAASLFQKGVLFIVATFCRRIRFLFSIFTTAMVYFCTCTWLFYGNFLFFSK